MAPIILHTGIQEHVRRLQNRKVRTWRAGCQSSAAIADPCSEQPLVLSAEGHGVHGELLNAAQAPSSAREAAQVTAGFPPVPVALQHIDTTQSCTAQMPTPAAVATASRPSLGPSAVMFMLGAAVASTFQSLVTNLTTAAWQDIQTDARARAPDPFGPDVPPLPPRKESRTGKKDIVPDSESVEWVNMCVRKIWRVYQRGLETWISGLLQPVFDNSINADKNPAILQRIRIARFTLNHEPPVFDSMQRRNSRKESDLNGVFSVRYSGGAKMLLVLELGGNLSGVEIPVMVEDFDLDARMWIKVRLAPMCPWIGVISVAFVEQPRIQVQLNTYGMLPLMRIPVLQNFLRKLLTVELPGVMVLPQRLEINLPPSVTVLAEAAVGRDTVMRAVASAVLQADAMEQALINALPMDAANVASAVSVPEAFVGEVAITIVEGRNLPVWGFPWQSNPYCRIVLGSQAVDSKRERETGSRGSFRCPNWNQEFQFLVEDSPNQCVMITVYDSPYTGRTEVGHTKLLLEDMPKDGTLQVWLPVYLNPGCTESQGELYVRASYRAFDSIGDDSGLRLVNEDGVEPSHDITDVRSAAEASARAAVEASKGMEALAVAKAAAARAAARLRGREKHQAVTERGDQRTFREPGPGGEEVDNGAGSSSDEALGGDTETWPQAPPLGSLEGEHVYAQQLVSAVEDSSRMRRAEVLASELGQGAVARVTGKSTPPQRQATLKKRIDELAAPIAAELTAQERAAGAGAAAGGSSGADALPLTAAATRDGGGGGGGGGKAPGGSDGTSSENAQVSSVLHNLDFDLMAEGDGSSASMQEVKITHELKHVNKRELGRSAAPPLLPGGLPGPGGTLLDELMVREATTRVSSVDTEDLAMLQPGRDVKRGAVPVPRGLRRSKKAVTVTGSLPPITESGSVVTADIAVANRPQLSAAARGAAAAVAEAGVVGERRAVGGALDLERETSSSDSGVQSQERLVHVSTSSYDGDDGSGFDGVGGERGTGGGLDSNSEGAALSTVDLGDFSARQRLDAVQVAREEDRQAGSVPVMQLQEAQGSAGGSEPPQVDAQALPEQRQPWWMFGFGGGAKSSSEARNGNVEEAGSPDTARASADAAAAAPAEGRGSRQWPWQGSGSSAARSDSDISDSRSESGSAESFRGSGSEAGSEDGEPQADGDEQRARPWWEGLAGLLGRREEHNDSAGGSQDGAPADSSAVGMKPAARGQIETVVVSPDLPIAEIAAEIARVKVKEEQDADEQNRLEGEKMMQGPIAQLERISEQLMKLSKPELVLLCGLSGGVLVLLAVIAYRLELYVQYESIVKDLVQ